MNGLCLNFLTDFAWLEDGVIRFWCIIHRGP